MKETQIEWSDSTTNFYVGCTPVSSGCKNCYMFRLEKRWGRDPSIVRMTDWETKIKELEKWEPRRIFVNNMSDSFHPDIPDVKIDEMFEILNRFPKHTYMILTKRIERAAKYFQGKKLPDNFWMGTSIESQNHVSRADALRRIDAKVHYISFEPLLGEITNINLDHIEWMIVGGESGYRPRTMKPEWVDALFKLSRIKNVAFFFKQWGGGMKKCKCHKSFGCRLYQDKTWDEMPNQVIA